MDEVFGSENFVRLITFVKTGSMVSNELGRTSDYLIWYAKDKQHLKYRQLYSPKLPDDFYSNVELADGSTRKITKAESVDVSLLPEGAKIFRIVSLESSGPAKEDTPLEFEGEVFRPNKNRHWSLTYPDGMEALKKTGRIVKEKNKLGWKYYIDDYPLKVLSEVWSDTSGFNQEQRYIVETRTKVVERCLLMTTDPGDLVLDPTCGSGTTAYVAESWGRRWLTIDTSRVALALARTRLMEAKYPYYLLADSPEGNMKEAALANDPNRAVNTKTSGDIKRGFVYERVPHITLKAIANTPEIDAIHAKWQEQLEPLRAEINSLASENWEEWEIPHLESAKYSSADESANYKGTEKKLTIKAKCLAAIEKWWQLRRERQTEIDAAIARHSEGEILYDKPFEDKKRLRVTGPFTVESLSPHRVLSSDEGTNNRLSQPESPSFETMIIENLKKAGVQNTVKDERLKFDWIEPYAGEWIHVEGEYTENGETKRAAVSIGPEHGTVSPELIKEAAKEAVKGLGFDLLIVCGFAFDPHVSEEGTRYGKLTVLSARMNPDLTMGDELLKKTGAGNLFMVFGEPDVEIDAQPDGQVVVEVKGVDVYDPTTGLVRSNSTDDIACWFIDTNYNGESFFVRHAYFTGADEPYKQLKRALKAEIDEAAWETLYRTRSRPFDKPITSEIAVKVINHYGDEVLKVYSIK